MVTKSQLMDFLGKDGFAVEVTKVDFGSLKAFADVTLRTQSGDVTVKGFRVVHQNGKEAWVPKPQSSFMKNGEIVNRPLIELPQILERKIREAILEGYESLK